MQTYCNIITLFKSSVKCRHIVTLPHCSKAQQHADILQHYRVFKSSVTRAGILQNYHVVQKLGDMQTYCNISVLFKSSVTCWYIATLPRYSNARWNSDIAALPCCSQARWRTDTLQHYLVIQKFGVMLTHCNITPLFKSSVSCWHITTLPCYAEVRMLTYCNITPLFKSSVTSWQMVTSCYSRVAYAIKWLDWLAGARLPAGIRDFFLSTTSRRTWAPMQSSVQGVPVAICLEVKQADLEH
jgi:hypothetical protein